MARVKKSPKQSGFTLIEMLIVLAIIGVLGAGALQIFGRETSQAQLRTVQSNLVADLAQARSTSQKLNVFRSVRFLSPTSYEIRQGASFAAVNPTSPPAPPAALVTVTLPANLQMEKVTGSGPTVSAITGESVTYQPPFGLAPAALAIRITNSNNSGLGALYIKVIGVTGKVISSASY